MEYNINTLIKNKITRNLSYLSDGIDQKQGKNL